LPITTVQLETRRPTLLEKKSMVKHGGLRGCKRIEEKGERGHLDKSGWVKKGGEKVSVSSRRLTKNEHVTGMLVPMEKKG